MDLFLIRGPKRSGNHLLVNWILSYYESSFFCNNCYPKDFATIKHIEEKIANQNTEAVIFSFEFPQLISKMEISRLLSCSKYDKTFSPILIRDPFNWMASFLYRKFTQDKQVELDYCENRKQYWNIWVECFDIWKDAPLSIDYNQFISSKIYREEIANKMELPFNSLKDTQSLNTLWAHKDVRKPSSFDTLSIKSKKIQPAHMKVFERYKRIVHLFDTYGIPSDVTDRSKDFWSLCYTTQ